MKRTSQVILITLISGITVFCTSGCVYTSAWRDVDAVAGVDARPNKVLLTLTAVEVKRGQRKVFFKQTRQVLADLPNHEGLLGYSFRFEVFGNKAWTMTAWRDELARDRFAQSRVHRAAVDASSATTADMRFNSLVVDRSELPMSWKQALQLLDSATRYPPRKPETPHSSSPTHRLEPN